MTAPDIREAEERVRRAKARHDIDAAHDAGGFCQLCDLAQDYLDLLAVVREVLMPALEECPRIADRSMKACVTDEELDVATTIRNLLIAHAERALAQAREMLGD